MPIAGLKDEGAGLRFGPYLSVRKLGDGGMGTVYLAIRVDAEFEKHVAIKCVRNRMATQRVIDRFRHERQILARLEHPNIARLLDGGTTDEGYPYLVMEYVSGQVITDYCDALRLKIRDRLVIFRKVLSAIQYAHQCLIVHRDIKPGNILVAPGGEPKLLDFGIAKLVGPDADTEVTATEARMLTPEYSSPEQIMGGIIGTATDIYSLGLLLYELLTGIRAHQLASTEYAAIQETVCRHEVLMPSQVNNRLISELSGDLDTIIMKALRKDPARRYQTAEQFDEDLRRYLEGLPIDARKETFGYVFGKFCYRHRIGVVAASAVLASIVFGISGARLQALAAERNLAMAERSFNEVRELTKSQFDLQDAVRNLPGAGPVRQILVAQAARTIDRLTQDGASSAELADAIERLSLLRFDENASHAGDLGGAIAAHRKSLDLRKRAFDKDRSNQAAALRYAQSLTRLGRLLFLSGDWDAARTEFERAAQLLDWLASLSPGDTAVRLARAAHQMAAGDLAAGRGESAALRDYESALNTVRELRERDPGNTAVRNFTGELYLRIGASAADPDLALKNYQTARDLYRESAAADIRNAWLPRRLAFCEAAIGDAYLAAKDPEQAQASYESSLAILRPLHSIDPADPDTQRAFAFAESRLALALQKNDSLESAIETGRRALAAQQALAERKPALPKDLEDAAFTYAALASMLDKQKEREDALDNYRHALALEEELAKNSAPARARLANLRTKIGAPQ